MKTIREVQLEEENEKIKKYYFDNINMYEDLLVKYSTVERWYQLNKSRINKAIEYIEKYVSYYDMEGDLRNRLLNILKGDNK